MVVWPALKRTPTVICLSSRRRVTSSMRRRTIRLRSLWGVRGSDHRAGKSVASAGDPYFVGVGEGRGTSGLAIVFVLGGSERPQ